MMHRLARYDVMLRIMMLLILFAMMRCLPKALVEAVIIHKVNIIGIAIIICRRQTSFKKTTFVW